MKRSQIILATIFILLTGSIYIVLANNKKEKSKTIKEEESTVYVPVRAVQNRLNEISLISYGQITPNAEVVVSFEVQGKLEKGKITVKPGTNFSNGEVLFQINSEEAFYTLSARKTSLANLVLMALPDIELDFPSEKDKWLTFLDKIDPNNLLPEFPVIHSQKEKMFLTSRNILTEFYNLKSLEERYKKYIYFAPFSGTVTALYAEPGTIINPGSQIARIAKTGDYEVKVPISMDDLSLFKEKSSAEFTDSKGTIIAKGKIIRISDVVNQQTQSADVYYSINAIDDNKIYNGMFVNVAISSISEKETSTLPRVAVNNGKVLILKGNRLTTTQVNIVSSKPDSVFVTGLKNGQMVLLEQIEEVNKKTKYEGITR